MVDAVRAAPYPDKQIIIVDDRSTDGTSEVLKRDVAPPVDEIIFHPVNRKRRRYRSGIERASGGVIIIQDADLEYDPMNTANLSSPSQMAAPTLSLVLASWAAGHIAYSTLAQGWQRRLDALVKHVHQSKPHGYRNLLQGLSPRHYTRNPFGGRPFGFEPEVIAKIAKTGCRIYEVGISYHGRTYAEGKIGWKDGVRAIYCILKYNLFR